MSRGSLALFGLQFREAVEDERVGLVGQLGDEREVITAETVGVVIVLGVVHVGPGEGHVVEFLLVGFVLPHGGFNPAEAEGFHRQLGAGGGFGSRGGLSGLGGHIVPFLILRSGIAVSPKAGVPAGTRGRLGGFLSRRTRTLPVRAAAARLEGPPETEITIPKKRTCRLGGVARKNADRSQP
ncbi:hypothetical protein DF3PB_40045 [uncultured Defluviicoccus sp.]|uniref:Uncharacterized protein n=1 Tax=metagenome TaxID=256318 RepID=A0A380TGG8_9ZZZZ|nr:hypothetical protein DF3PB_40045 [uncultured Defluviicoccus sp.]